MARALEIPQFKNARPLRRRSDEQRLRKQWSAIRPLISPIWLPEISAQLNRLKELGFNWDSYGSEPITAKALFIARRMFSELDISNHPKPHVCAVAGGGVGIHWRIGSRDLELEADRDGNITYLQTELPDGMIEGTAGDAQQLQAVLDWVLGW